MSSQPTTSEKRYRRLKWVVLASAFGFIVVTAISLYYRIPGVLAWPSEAHIKHSYDGSILTLPKGHANVTRETTRNQQIDTAPRVASAALPFLLHPTANLRLASPRTNQPLPLNQTIVPLETPQPYETAWVELPPRFIDNATSFFNEANLHAWAMAMLPNGLLIIDIDAREQTCTQLQQQLQSLHVHFPILQLWQTGMMRWQFVCAKTPLRLDPETINQLPKRFPELHQMLIANGTMTPWALFAACVTTDASALRPLHLQPDEHLTLAFQPHYQATIDELFTTPPPNLMQIRDERFRFMNNRFIAESPSSDPYLHAIVEELLFGDTLQHPRLTLQTLQPLLDHLQPTLRVLQHYLTAAQYANNKTALDDALRRLQQLPSDHPQRASINTLLFNTYLRLGDKHHAYFYAQCCQTETASTTEQAYFNLEVLFLQTEIEPTREHLNQLHAELAKLQSESRQTHLKRYTDLLMQNGYAQEALNILSSLTQTQQFPTSPF